LRTKVAKYPNLKLWVTADWSDITACEELAKSKLIIEATKEDLISKSKIISQVSTVAHVDALIATTTSSLSITSLSEAVNEFQDLVGLHFFNPISRNNLVEVILTKSLSKRKHEVYSEFMILIQKTPIYVPDRPGFVINAILFSMLESALQVLMTTNLTPTQIDESMKSVCKHPLGPFELIDFIGIDTTLEIIRNLGKYSDEVLVHLQLMIDEGNLGKKTKQGFYKY
jgi:3-hydroxyacyl-CoA dehydrogenase